MVAKYHTSVCVTISKYLISIIPVVFHSLGISDFDYGGHKMRGN